MRIRTIELTWFRGAATKTTLNTNGKSAAIYGDNACGKSSFVDAVEYIITKGKIAHLRNEYSDLYLNNCVRNTETPADEACTAKICFNESDFVQATVPPSGKFDFTGSSNGFLEKVQSWDLKRHVLRQNEVSNFIHSTKSEKYSTLSPLLGLQEYEDIAQNLLKIKEAVKKTSKYEKLDGAYSALTIELSAFFPSMDNDTIKKIVDIHAIKYLSEVNQPTEIVAKQAISKIEQLLNDKEPEVKRYLTIENLIKVPMKETISLVAKTEAEISEVIEAFIDHKISVLEHTQIILDSTDLATEIECPACGQKIFARDFKVHVDDELQSLKRARELRNRSIEEKKDFRIALANFRSQVTNGKEFNDWLSKPENLELKLEIDKIKNIVLGKESERWSIEKIGTLKNTAEKITMMLSEAVKNQQPATTTIVEDLKFFEACLKIKRMEQIKEALTKISLLLKTLDSSYELLRREIADVTHKTLAEISQDIARIWCLIHPGQPIENIHLSPSDKEKAIEVSLKFHGKVQDDPRLTLSEGYRNSLGLSIFLALANQGNAKDNPILLDDIVSSLDRDHRGMVSMLLQKELAQRQVLLFTHDREWFSELSSILDTAQWEFFTLKKWVSPVEGIEVLPTTYTFDETEAMLVTHVNSVGNMVRAIMDTELPRCAQKLRLKMLYLQGHANDKRMAVDFLNELISEGNIRFQINNNSSWKIHKKAINSWEESKRLLIGWANRASHGGSLSQTEAKELIDACKGALSYFKCSEPNCQRKAVWALDAGDYVRCDCGNIRWKMK